MFKFDSLGNSEPLGIYLATPSNELLCYLNDAIDDETASLQVSLNNQYSLSFDITKVKDNEIWFDKIVENMYLFVEDIGFFRISKPEEEVDGDLSKKSVTAYGCESELEDKACKLSFNLGTNTSQESIIHFAGEEYKNWEVVNPYTGVPYDWFTIYNTYPEQLKILKHRLTGLGNGNITIENDNDIFDFVDDILSRITRLKFKSISGNDYKVINFVTRNTNGIILDNTDEQFISWIDELIGFYSTNRNKMSILSVVLEKTDGNWSVGSVDGIGDVNKLEDLSIEQLLPLDYTLANTKLQFESDENIYSFLTQTFAKGLSGIKDLESIIEFDRVNRKISLKKISNIGSDTGINLSYDNLLNSVRVAPENDSFATRFYVNGADNLGIEQVNFGKDYIDDLSYVMNAKSPDGELIYVSKDLSDKYSEYISAIEEKREEYIECSKQYAQYNEKINEITYRVPNSYLETDWSTFTKEELSASLTNFKNLLNTLKTLYYEDFGKEISSDEDVKDTAYWADYKAYTGIIGEIECALEVLPYYNDKSKWTVTQKEKYENIKAWETEWSLYGISELEAKKASFEQNMKLLLETNLVFPLFNFEVWKNTDKGVEAENTCEISNITDNGFTVLATSNDGYTKQSPVTKLECGKYHFICDFLVTPPDSGTVSENKNYAEVFVFDKIGVTGNRKSKTEYGASGTIVLDFEVDNDKNFKDSISFRCDSNYEGYSVTYSNFRLIRDDNPDGTFEIKPNSSDYRSDYENNKFAQGDNTVSESVYENYISYFKKWVGSVQELNKLYGEKRRLESAREEAQSKRTDIAKSVEYSNYSRFTKEDIETINRLIRESDYTNDNILVTSIDTSSDKIDRMKSLLDDSKEQLSRYSRPQLSFTINSDNFPCISEYKNICDEFMCGNFITVQYRDDTYIKLRLIQYTVNPCLPSSESFDMVFSNFIMSNSSLSDLESILSSSSSGGGRSVSNSGGSGGGTYGQSDNIDVTISNTMLSKLLNSESFGTRVANVVLDTIDVNSLTAKCAKFEGLKNGTTTIDGGCITTGLIKSVNYNGNSTNILGNNSGSVINLTDGTFNFGGGKLKWDGTQLRVEGYIDTQEGYIGGFIISESALYSVDHNAYNADSDGVYISPNYISLGKNGTTIFEKNGSFSLGGGKLKWNGDLLTLDGDFSASGTYTEGSKEQQHTYKIELKDGRQSFYSDGNSLCEIRPRFRSSPYPKFEIIDTDPLKLLKTALNSIFDLYNTTPFLGMYGDESKSLGIILGYENGSKIIINNKTNTQMGDILLNGEPALLGGGKYYRAIFHNIDETGKLISHEKVRIIGLSTHGNIVIGDDQDGNNVNANINLYSKKDINLNANGLVKLKDGSAVTSDENLKYDIEPLDIRHEKLFDLLEAKTFKYTFGKSGRSHFGFIAQPFKNAILDSGLTTNDIAAYVEFEDDNGSGETTCAIRYSEIIPLNTHMIKKCLQSENETILKVSQLEEKINYIINKLNGNTEENLNNEQSN